MEIRIKIVEKAEVRLFFLIQNHIADRKDKCTITAVSDDYHKLIDWYEKNVGLPPIEYFNPIDSVELNHLSCFGHGIKDEWVDVETLPNIKNSYYFLGENNWFLT